LLEAGEIKFTLNFSEETSRIVNKWEVVEGAGK